MPFLGPAGRAGALGREGGADGREMAGAGRDTDGMAGRDIAGDGPGRAMAGGADGRGIAAGALGRGTDGIVAWGLGATGALTGGFGTDTGGLLTGGLTTDGRAGAPGLTEPPDLGIGRFVVAAGRDGVAGPGLTGDNAGFGPAVTPCPFGSTVGRDATFPAGFGSVPGLAVTGGFAPPFGGTPAPVARPLLAGPPTPGFVTTLPSGVGFGAGGGLAAVAAPGRAGGPPTFGSPAFAAGRVGVGRSGTFSATVFAPPVLPPAPGRVASEASAPARWAANWRVAFAAFCCCTRSA